MGPFFRFLPLTIVCLSISYLSHQSGDAFPPLELPEGVDKIAHFFMFLFVGAGAGFGFQSVFWKSQCFGLFFAMFDEWHQSFIPGRTPEFMDIVFDMMGTLVGILILQRWLQRKKVVHDG